MNLIIISGHLVGNPQLKRYGEQAVINNTIAHNHTFTDREGNRRDEVSFLDIEVWNGLAQTICQYVTTKRKIQLCGRLKQDRWEKEGEKHSRLVLMVESFQFMDSPQRSATATATEDPPASP